MEAKYPAVAKFFKDHYTGSELEQMQFIIRRTPHMVTRYLRGTNQLDYNTCVKLLEYDHRKGLNKFPFCELKEKSPEMFDLTVLELVELTRLEYRLKKQ